MSTDFDPSPSRGVEHVGMTVPDIEAATSFFVGAFGAEILFDMSPPGTNVFRGID